MKFAADFRSIARGALRGNWLSAVLTAFLASLIGAQLYSSTSAVNIELDSEEIYLLQTRLNPEVVRLILAILSGIVAYGLITGIIMIIIGGAGKLGYARYNLNLVDNVKTSPADLFSQFHRLGAGFVMQLLMAVYTFLWSLLFFIPGIIKTYSYAMTPYILSEHPECSPDHAITLSRQMMDGNKYRLFCLEFSFIGWDLLSSVPSIIAMTALSLGNLRLMPLLLVGIVGKLFVGVYREAAHAAFYREVSGTEYRPYNTEPGAEGM